MSAYTYDEVIEKINNIHRFGSASGREITVDMMEKLNHPEHGMKVIHIAGTNGKGSTAAFISKILMNADFIVGTFTSPHLIDFRERITVNEQMIPKDDVTRLGNQLFEMQFQNQPTMFDYCLAMAMLYYKEQGCDYIVLETGLGGGKDSTSGLDIVPIVSIITRIGLDHTAILGDTLPQIAAEKAGILKTGTYAVIGVNDESAEEVLIEKCKEKDIPYWSCNRSGPKLKQMDDSGLANTIAGLPVYQRENALNAFIACDYLLGNCPKKEEYIVSGIQQMHWMGRLETIPAEKNKYNVDFIVDGAHNPQGVHALYDSISQAYPNKKFILLMGVLSDKNYEEMLDTILPLAQEVYTIAPPSDRALDAKTLADEIAKRNIPANSCQTVIEGIEKASQKAIQKNIKVLAFGSLYFIGDVLKEVIIAN